jgi:hypothetical protein
MIHFGVSMKRKAFTNPIYDGSVPAKNEVQAEAMK